jgi:flagella basal body P-ring formation protein FlgA
MSVSFLNFLLIFFVAAPAYSNEWYAEHSPWGEGKVHQKMHVKVMKKMEDDMQNLSEDQPVILELKGHAVIKGTRALAGDVLSCEGVARICSLINSVDLGIDLTKTSSKILTKNRIITLLETEVGADVSFGGTSTVKVERKRYTVQGDQIRNSIKDVLEANLHCGVDCKVGFSVSPVLQKHLLYSSDWEIKILNLDHVAKRVLSSRKISSIKVKWAFVGESLKSKYTFVKIQRLKRKLVFTSDFSKGKSISSEDVEFRWVSLKDKGYFEPEFEGKEYTLKRAVKEGQLITNRFLKLPYLVKRGQVVDLISKKGNLTIKLSAKALNNAHLGSEVKVRVIGKKARRLTGIARSGSIVEVL